MTDILGLKLLHSSDHYSELTDSEASIKFMLRQAPTLAHASHGFSPMLSFEVADLQQTVERAQKEYECQIDGEVVEDEYLKLACLRTQCGISFSLQQVLQVNEAEIEYDKFTKEHGTSSLEKENNLDVKT